jgi:hypothetical protein
VGLRSQGSFGAPLRRIAAPPRWERAGTKVPQLSIRSSERAGDFGPRFIELARSVYETSDQRAAIKRRINEQLCSEIVAEKSYRVGNTFPRL